MKGRMLVAVIVMVAALTVGTAAARSAQIVGWTGVGHVTLGESLRSVSKVTKQPQVMSCGVHLVRMGALQIDDRGGPRGRVAGIETSARNVVGPLHVRVGMSPAALRRALGHGAVRFRARGRAGLMRVGPRRRVVWALESRARTHRVELIGVSINVKVARRAALAGLCIPPKPQPTTTPTQPSPTTTPTPPAPTPTPPVCPTSLPKVGAYMHVACGTATGNVIQYTCHPDWLDTNHDPADGCEAEQEGLHKFWFQTWSNESLRNRLQGFFTMNGYGEAVDAPDWGSYPDQAEVTGQSNLAVIANCDTAPITDCASGTADAPAPTLHLDMAKHVGDVDRAIVSVAGAPESTDSTITGAMVGYPQATVTVHARVTSNEPMTYHSSGETCDVAIDSTAGASTDVTIAGTLTRSGSALDGPPELSGVAVTGIDSADVTVTGDLACMADTPTITTAVEAMITPTFTTWLTDQTRLCGAVGPYWWQPCPPAI